MKSEQGRSILPLYGQRELIIGPTGSGKTQFAGWMLRRLEESPIIIYDTKGEESFPLLPKATIVTDWDGVHEAANNDEFDYVILRPDETEPEELDGYLMAHFEDFEGVPAYIDEIGDFHSRSGHAFSGLMHLLRKGRARGQTTIMSTQRPSNISRFCYTESQKFCVFSLVHEDDQKHVAKFIPGYKALEQPDRYGFYYYEVGDKAPHLIPPIALDKPLDTSPGNGAASPELKDRFEWI